MSVTWPAVVGISTSVRPSWTYQAQSPGGHWRKQHSKVNRFVCRQCCVKTSELNKMQKLSSAATSANAECSTTASAAEAAGIATTAARRKEPPPPQQKRSKAAQKPRGWWAYCKSTAGALQNAGQAKSLEPGSLAEVLEESR